MMRRISVVALFLLVSFAGFSQTSYFKPYQKGKFYFYWGWNRAMYTKSDLSLKGDDYDLEIKRMEAHDRQTPFSVKEYLKYDHLTVPQNNWRLGYFLKDNLAISFGLDHMKYVMDQDQVAEVKGTITREGQYQGTYDGPQQLTEDFLTFEHTDGLNYVHLELEKYNTFYQSKNGNVILSAILEGGAGILYPKTNAKLLDYERNDRFHLSGWGASAALGLEGVFWKHLGLRFEMKTGYINMPNIILHKEGINGKGKQSFGFGQMNGTIVYHFGIGHKSK